MILASEGNRAGNSLDARLDGAPSGWTGSEACHRTYGVNIAQVAAAEEDHSP